MSRSKPNSTGDLVWPQYGPVKRSNVLVLQPMTFRFADIVAAVLAETGMPPKMLTLEITESVFITDSDRALVVLKELGAPGVRVALDDFGTGYVAELVSRQLLKFQAPAVDV
jgi:EAL domain-containing protein (putative c-di-GMP-specific phosphodiesterase class I)